MNEREGILRRVRDALRAPSAPGPSAPASDADAFRGVTPPVGASLEENLALFRRFSEVLKTDFRLLTTMEELKRELRVLAQGEGWRRVATHRGPLADAVREGVDLPWLWLESGYDPEALEACDAGVTECDALVAQTGSVLVTSHGCGGRALSVLPPHHVVLARREQVVPGLVDALRLVREKYHDDFPSMISFVTGPSRTGDIERILVLGAHGPKKLTVLCY